MGLPLMPFASRKNLRLKNLIRDAGLSANLKICLDPGDRNSWPGSGSTWFDVSGNGYHFTLGSAASPVASGPSFVGSVGDMSANEYWSSAGGQGFSLTSGANDTFLNSLHKIGGQWMALELCFTTSGYGAGFNTHTGVIGNTTVGIGLMQAPGLFPQSVVGNGSQQVNSTATPAGANNVIQLYGWGRKITSNTNRDTAFYTNSTYEFNNSTSSFTPSASNASLAARLGLTSDGSTAMTAGRRLYGFAMFDRILTQAECDALRARFLKRWSGF